MKGGHTDIYRHHDVLFPYSEKDCNTVLIQLNQTLSDVNTNSLL